MERRSVHKSVHDSTDKGTPVDSSKPSPKKTTKTELEKTRTSSKPVKSMNPSKKRYQRYSRKCERLRKRSLSEEEISDRFRKRKLYKLSRHPRKTIEDFLVVSDYKTPVHKLEFKLVQSWPESEEFKKTKLSEHGVYCKYQVAVHGDEEKECTMKQFDRFLCRSPLTQTQIFPGSAQKMGSYHLQYWLDDQLIAVAVLDIMATGVSSVYLFYDPDHSFLSLGRVSALQEIAFVRNIYKLFPDFKFYYMGYYIHDCSKMPLFPRSWWNQWCPRCFQAAYLCFSLPWLYCIF
jgi:arginyl-tRNA--protein-N-Asp/Glu arginylyltransferase